MLKHIHSHIFPQLSGFKRQLSEIVLSALNFSFFYHCISLQLMKSVVLHNIESAVLGVKFNVLLFIRYNGKSSMIQEWHSGFGGLEDACWPLVPKFTGSNPAEAVRFFRAKEFPARNPSEGGGE
jgi:hypothetical protein